MKLIVYLNRKFKAGHPEIFNELVNTLRLGLKVVEWDIDEMGDLPDDGVCYIGWTADEVPSNLKDVVLSILPNDMPALTALLLNFALGYIPQEIAAFRGSDQDIVSRQRLIAG